MVWIESLELETIFIRVFAGSATYFVPIAIFAIMSVAAYFRMTALTMGFMIFIFLLMFSGFFTSSLVIFISIIVGLLVGYAISKIVKG